MPRVLGLSFSVYDKPIPLLLETSHCLVPADASWIFALPSLSSAVSYTQWLFCVALSTRHPSPPSACSHTVSLEEPDPCLSSPICDSRIKEIRAPTSSLPHLSRHLCVSSRCGIFDENALSSFFFQFPAPSVLCRRENSTQCITTGSWGVCHAARLGRTWTDVWDNGFKIQTDFIFGPHYLFGYSSTSNINMM